MRTGSHRSADGKKHSTNDKELERTVYRHKRVAYSELETKFEGGVENSFEVCVCVCVI